MRDPVLWSQIFGETPPPEAHLASFAAQLGVSVSAARRIAAEVPRLRYLDAIAPYTAAPPLALLTLLQRPIPDPEDIDAAARYRETRALYEIEFGAPPPDIWTDHPPALVAAQLARHGNAVDGVPVQRGRTSWLATGPVLALFLVLVTVDVTSDEVDINLGLQCLAGFVTLILLWGSLAPKRNPLIDPVGDEDAIAARQRLGLYLWADGQLAARRQAAEDGETVWEDDGSDGGDGGGGD